MSNDRLELLDFGMGLLAGLRIRGVDALSENNIRKLHASFVKAFATAKQEFAQENVKFIITTHYSNGTSGGVESILRYWLNRSYAAYDPRNTIWMLDMDGQSAEEILAKLPGGREVYLKAADAFLQQYRNN